MNYLSLSTDGAYEGKSGFTVYDQPVGDAIVVYTEITPKVKAEKVEGVPTAAELKTLRKEWRDLKDDLQNCRRHRCYSGEVIVDEERHSQAIKEDDDKRNAIKKEMLKRAVYLANHDTPFIKRQMASWAKHNFYMRRHSETEWQCGTDELHIIVPVKSAS